MAEPELENLDAEEDAKAKKPSPVGFIIGIVVVTVIAVGAGWFLGGQFAAKPKKMVMAKVEQKIVPKEDEAGEKEGKDGKKVDLGPIVKLEPIIVVLRNSKNAFLRLELAIVTQESGELSDEESKLRLMEAISAFSRTLTIRQISGPSGYLHFREDILDVARLTTNGIVKNILILSMVAE